MKGLSTFNDKNYGGRADLKTYKKKSGSVLEYKPTLYSQILLLVVSVFSNVNTTETFVFAFSIFVTA